MLLRALSIHKLYLVGEVSILSIITSLLYLVLFRSAVKAVVERLTQSSFYTTARALFERDRLPFALLCALEVRYFKAILPA